MVRAVLVIHHSFINVLISMTRPMKSLIKSGYISLETLDLYCDDRNLKGKRKRKNEEDYNTPFYECLSSVTLLRRYRVHFDRRISAKSKDDVLNIVRNVIVRLLRKGARRVCCK